MVIAVGCTGNTRASYTETMVAGAVAANPYHSPLVDEQTFKKMWNELETTTSTVSLSLDDSFESSTMWNVGEWQKDIKDSRKGTFPNTQQGQVDEKTAWTLGDDGNAFPEPRVLFPDDINELVPTQKKEVQPLRKSNTSCGDGDGFKVAAKNLSQMLVESNLFVQKAAPAPVLVKDLHRYSQEYEKPANVDAENATVVSAEASSPVSPSKLHHRRNSSGVIIMDDRSCELSLPYTNTDVADDDDDDDETVTTCNTYHSKIKCKLGTCGQNDISSTFCLQNINTGINVVDSVIKGLCIEIGCAATDVCTKIGNGGIHGGGNDDISATDTATTATALDDIQRRIERTIFREDIHVKENNDQGSMGSRGRRRYKTLQVMETAVHFSPPKEERSILL